MFNEENTVEQMIIDTTCGQGTFYHNTSCPFQVEKKYDMNYNN